MKIGILGGAFDPPTWGHLQAAKFVADQTDMDRIWLMPCCWHNFGKEMAYGVERIRMLQLALSWSMGKYIPRIVESSFELDNHMSGKTWETVKKLRRIKKHKEDQFFWIIGLDNANNFDRWEKADWLKQNAAFIVIPRKGVKPNTKIIWYQHPPHIDLTGLPNPIMQVSSSKVRESIRQHKASNLRRWLPPGAWAHIKNHHLYGWK